MFICWHPAHVTNPLPCCSRPTSAVGKYLQGLHFFGRQAADPQEFVSAVQWWLGGTIRLGLVPALWLLIPEIFLRLDLHLKAKDVHFPGRGCLGNNWATRFGTGRTTSTTSSSLSLATASQRQKKVVSKMFSSADDVSISSLAASSVASSRGCSSWSKL